MINTNYLINHIRQSILDAYVNKSKLTDDILNMEGMSGHKNRHLYNNICHMRDINYLEVGTYKGSSFISSMYNNNISGVCVDNWSEFDCSYDVLINNIFKYIPNSKYKVIEKDCFTLTKSDIPYLIDVYLYDGEHTYECHKKAITHFHDFFSKYVIILVDDWFCEYSGVKKGTLDGIKAMNMVIHYSYEIPLVNSGVTADVSKMNETTFYDNTYFVPNLHQGGNTFWNGTGIFLCERTDI